MLELAGEFAQLQHAVLGDTETVRELLREIAEVLRRRGRLLAERRGLGQVLLGPLQRLLPLGEFLLQRLRALGQRLDRRAARLGRLEPLGMRQVTRVVRDLGRSGDVSAGRLDIAPASGSVAAYASSIDNLTNDPRTLLPQ